jgi:hypothetical protein
MSTPELSVLIPAYKAQGTIRAAVNSALGERDVEVIVAPDDGTNDYKCLESEYKGKVKVLEPTCQTGPGAGRNRAFEASSGKLVTMLDADDEYAAGAISEAIDLCAKSASGIAFFQTHYVNEKTSDSVRRINFDVLTFDDVVEFNGSIHSIFPRGAWLPYSSLLAEDVLHDAQILLKAGGVAPMTRRPYILKLHPDSMCANTNQDKFNKDYGKIAIEAFHPEIRRLFAEKVAVGNEYAQALSDGMNLGFHQFVMYRQSLKQAQANNDTAISRQVG